MLIRSFLFSYLLALGMCSYPKGSALANVQVIDYQAEDNRYVVVVLMDEISEKQAKKFAKEKAAQISISQGKQYFVVESEEVVQVVKSERSLEDSGFYGNMYQELIIEGDFNRDRMRYRQVPNTKIYSGIRLIFVPYEEKPSRKAEDACKWTDCSQFKKGGL